MATDPRAAAIEAARQEELLRGRPYAVLRALRSTLTELWSDKAGLFGLAVMVGLLLAAVFAPLLAPYPPDAQSLFDRLEPPSRSHPFGTDQLGRDVLSRVIYGARVSLEVGVGVVLIAGTFGTFMGLMAGYRGGRTSSFIMRWVDTQVAFPGLLLALVILSVVHPSLKAIIIVLALNGWMVYARMTRGVVLSTREKTYVESAELAGCRSRRVIFRHILPNLASPLLTLAVLEFARMVIAEAALSFLGLGTQPPAVSWGLMIAEGRDYIFESWWVITFPGIALSLTVLGANLFASWLRITADPLQRERRFARAAIDTSGALK
jgi:peptide/nickel transport system permease protein